MPLASREDDGAVVETLVDVLCHHDVWVAQNRRRLGLPHLRAWLLRWGLPLLPRLPLKYV